MSNEAQRRCSLCGTSVTDWDKHSRSQRHQQNHRAFHGGPADSNTSPQRPTEHSPVNSHSIDRDPNDPSYHHPIHHGPTDRGLVHHRASLGPTDHGSAHYGPIHHGPFHHATVQYDPIHSQSRWEGLLGKSAGPLTYIASAFQRLQRQENATSVSQEYGVPRKFPAQECWEGRPESADLFLDMLCRSFYERPTSIYSRQNPIPIDQPRLAAVIRQLYQPTEHEALFAINVPGGATVKIPEREGAYHLQSRVGTTSNLTPAFSYVPPHIDGGDNVLTLLYPTETLTAMKIWALFPPTEHNLQLHEKSYGGRDLFVHPWPLESGYEKGIIVVQSEKEAILLPPGYIHATFTLYGCITTGVQYATRASLESTAQILRMDALGFRNPSPEPFFRAVELAIALGAETEVIHELCRTLPSLRPQCVLPDVVAGLRCSCGKSWRSHFRR